MNKAAVLVENVSFSHEKENYLFKDLSLEIKKGSRFGLFGPNGAGKTTLMSLMTAILKPNAGEIYLEGNKIGEDKSIRSLFGFVPQDFSFYEDLTPEENLDFFASWYGMQPDLIHKRSQELLKIFGLENFQKKQVRKFSGGMKRRLNIIIGVLHQPQIIFLDEPTTGVDVQTRHAIIDFLKRSNDEGATIIYTSHLLNEAEDLCNVIALIDEGKIIAHDDLHKLLELNEQKNLEDLFLKTTGKAFRD